MNPNYPLVSKRAGHRCEYCQASEAIFNLPFEVEHIIPISRDGQDEGSNLALSCRACNLRKSNFLNGLDPVTKEKVRLFHPRWDIWAENFRVVKETAMIEGLTPVGRATVERLRMNMPFQLSARSQWIKLGIFP